MKKFLLIDDHAIIRSGLKDLLLHIYHPAEIHEAENGDTAVKLLKQNEYSLVTMDVQIPGTDTVGLMEYIHITFPALKVLIFSMSAENIYAKRFLKAGAKGFISKDEPLDEIKKAIDLILNGRTYISDNLAQLLAEASFSDTPENPFNKLSAREFEIASLLLSGQTLSEIAKTHNLSVSTVGTHKARLFEKLGVNNLLDLQEMARSYNL